MSRTLYWIKKPGVFGKGVKFGQKLPKLPKEREDQLLAQGYASLEQPANFDAAKESVLKQLKKKNQELVSQVEKLKSEKAKLESDLEDLQGNVIDSGDTLKELETLKTESDDMRAELAELRAELEDFPPNVKKANKRIKELEADLAAATNPDGK